VIVENGIHSFEIKHALGVVGTENAEKREKGLYKFSVTAGITAADSVLHDKARIAFINLLHTLAQAGWKPVLYYDDPRLSGEQALRYYLEEDPYGSAPVNYDPTLEDWMRIDSDSWMFYAGDLFLDIDVRRNRERMVVDEPGNYLLSFSLYNKEEQGRGHFKSEKRDQWQEHWVETIQKLKRKRYTIERELIEKGYTIDTGYVEPIIHPADPVEP